MKSTKYSIFKYPGIALLWMFDRLIQLVQPNQCFYDSSQFGWVSEIESHYPDIKRECLELLGKRTEEVPNLQDIFVSQKQLTTGKDWRSFMLYFYGYRIPANCEACPITDSVVRSIPGMKTAMFSILSPGKHIPAHRGPYKGVLRYHLGVQIPEKSGRCAIRVENQIAEWVEGKSLIFDDTLWHEAWNDTGDYRVVLFIDFKRGLPFPISTMNTVLFAILRRTSFIVNVLRKLNVKP